MSKIKYLLLENEYCFFQSLSCYILSKNDELNSSAVSIIFFFSQVLFSFSTRNNVLKLLSMEFIQKFKKAQNSDITGNI